MKILAIFCGFKLNLGVIIASAEGASEKFRTFYKGTTYDVNNSKFQGGAFAPPCTPLLTPMLWVDVYLKMTSDIIFKKH